LIVIVVVFELCTCELVICVSLFKRMVVIAVRALNRVISSGIVLTRNVSFSCFALILRCGFIGESVQYHRNGQVIRNARYRNKIWWKL